MKSLVLIDYHEACEALAALTADDIRRDGVTTPETFDNRRAIKAISKLYLYSDVVERVRCKDCIYREEMFIKDKKHEEGGFIQVFCKKRIDGYLGDDGYCSDGKRKERKDG